MIFVPFLATLFVSADSSRTLVLLADSPGNPIFIEQAAKAKELKARFEDYDLVVQEETDPKGPLHRRFGNPHAFAAILVGKDGGEKWRSHDAFDYAKVFAQIDSMPMRQREVRKRETSSP